VLSDTLAVFTGPKGRERKGTRKGKGRGRKRGEEGEGEKEVRKWREGGRGS